MKENNVHSATMTLALAIRTTVRNSISFFACLQQLKFDVLGRTLVRTDERR